MLKDMTCPICQMSFNTTKVRTTKLRMLDRDTDFCTYYEGVNPYFYEINVCPECGFAFSDNFNDSIADENANKFREIVSSKWAKRDFGGLRDIDQAIESFKLAIASAQIVGLKDSRVAGLCLRIAWLYRIKENREEEVRFMKWAVRLYEKAYQWEDFDTEDSMDMGTVLYLLGELNYRIGNYEKASNWFNIAITKLTNAPGVSARTMVLIRDRWHDIRADIKKAL